MEKQEKRHVTKQSEQDELVELGNGQGGAGGKFFRGVIADAKRVSGDRFGE